MIQLVALLLLLLLLHSHRTYGQLHVFQIGIIFVMFLHPTCFSLFTKRNFRQITKYK